MADELDFIEALDDLVNVIKAKKEKLGNGKHASGREPSARNGLILSDLEGQDDDIVDPNFGILDLWSGYQVLIEALFAQRTFLQYTPALERCITAISSWESGSIEPTQLKHFRCLVHLMVQTVENQGKHECTELRYATLLEIILSFQEDWTPSDTINSLWTLVERRVETDCDPTIFRREAYKILVSLPWSPESTGLYNACSYENSESIHQDLPPHVMAKLGQTNGSSLVLRSDKVHSVLQRLEEEDQETFIVSISYSQDDAYTTTASSATSIYNGQGVGKTTLAALIAAHPVVAENYSILWADLGTRQDDTPLTFQQYADCLEDLCQQLGAKPNWVDRILRIEDESVRIKRETEYIDVAKAGMTKLLQQIGLRFLVVIDGAQGDVDFELFQFTKTQSSIVVSKSPDIPGADITVDMEDLGVDESIALFAAEASMDRDDIIFHTNECKVVMQQCLHHPLIIRTAARWFRLKQVTAGSAKGLTELNLEMKMLRNSASGKADAFKVLAELMNLMLSPNKPEDTEPTVLLKLCLSSVAVVFAENTVPLDAVLSLWTKLLTTHPDAVEEIGDDLDSIEATKHIWYIVEVFVLLGIFSTTEIDGLVSVKLHHQLFVKYGLSLVPEVQQDDAEIVDTVAKWHNFFVIGYHERIKSLKTHNLEDRIQPYALKKLVVHMIEAKSIPQVLERLKDEKFCRERLKTYGWWKGARLHVEDCLLLRQRARESKSTNAVEIRKVILSCLKRMVTILGEESPSLTNDERLEKAMAIHLIGFTAADHHGISEALTQYKNAMQVMPTPGHPFNSIIMYSQAVLQLMRNDHDKALKKIKGCLKVLKDNEGKENFVPHLQNEMLQLKGDAMAASCDYLGAEACYEEALKRIEDQSKIETGNVLYRRARMHQIMGELDQALSALAECINWKHDISETSSRSLAGAYSVAADMYLDLEEADSARKHFENSLAIFEELEDGADEIDLLLLRGKIESIISDEKGGQEAFDEARKIIKKSPRLLMDQSAYDLRCIAKIYADRGEKKEAITVLEEGIDLTQNRPESLERACILYELAACMLDVGNTKESVTCYEETLSIRKSKLGDCELVLDTQIEVGKVYRKLNMHKEGLAAAKNVMFLTEKLFRDDEAKAASAVFGVAEVYEILEDDQEAVVMFEECKELLKRGLSPDHPDVARVLQRLAKLHTKLRDMEKAYSCYTEALEICKKKLEPDHPQLGETFFGTGIVARRRGELEMARDCLQEALKVYKELELSRELCLALIELGNVYRMANDPDTAAMCYERCLTFLEADEGEESASVSDILQLAYGHARLSKMELTEAYECYNSALTIRTEKLGKDHSLTATASLSVGIVKYLMKNFAEARLFLGDYIRAMDAKRTFDTVEYAMAFLLFGEMSHMESRPDEARLGWGKTRDLIQRNPRIKEELPELGEIVTSRLENAQPVQTEQKSLFSRFTELARFEDEQVSKELPIEQRIEEAIRNYSFEDG